jgi:diguanylate cyclase (GGDEF)-like protein
MTRAGQEDLAEAQLYALIEVAAAAAAAHRLEDVLELAAEQALGAIGAASLSISRWEGQTVRTLINVGVLAPGEERFPRDEHYPLADFPAIEKVLRSGGFVVAAVDDPSADEALRELMIRLEKESSLSVPIVFEDTTWGELWATSAPGEPRFTARDATFLRAVADQVASAIGRAELFEQVESLAYTDPLSGLANRRALEEALERAFVAPQDGAPTLVLCDIDDLKGVNDAHGHEAGDRLIVRVGHALARAGGDHDGALVARIGGDEFCVLLPSSGLEAGKALVEAARTELGADPAQPAGFSAGVAARSEEIDRPAALLRAADAAQYRAKRRGRGLQVAVETDALAAPLPGEERAYRGRAPAARALADELLGMLEASAGEPAEERLARLRERLRELAGG